MKKLTTNLKFASYLFAGIFILFFTFWAMSQDVADGFASVSGVGLSNTTGDEGGSAVIASNFSDLKSNCGASVVRIIIVSQSISGSGNVTLTRNKTIKGANNNVKLSGFTLDMRSVSNIIISDLEIVGGVDGIAGNKFFWFS